MPLRSRIFVLLAVLSLSSCGPGADEKKAAAEFDRLEASLVALSEAPEDQWMDRLDDVGKISLTSDRVVEVRDLCVSAYQAFGDATMQLEEARHRVAGVEILARNGPGDAGLAEVAGMRAQAARATEGVSKALDRAEELVASCVASRRRLREMTAAGTLTE